MEYNEPIESRINKISNSRNDVNLSGDSFLSHDGFLFNYRSDNNKSNKNNIDFNHNSSLSRNSEFDTSNMITVEKTFPYSLNIVKQIWDEFYNNGYIERIGKKSESDHINDKIEGNAIFDYLDESVIPEDIAFSVIYNQNRYLVGIKVTKFGENQIEVSISSGFKNLKNINRLFKMFKDDEVIITKRYNRSDEIEKIYNYIKENSTDFKIVNNSYKKSEITIGENNKDFLSNGKFRAKLDGFNYTFEIKNEYSNEYILKIHANKSNVNKISNFMKKLSYSFKDKGPSFNNKGSGYNDNTTFFDNIPFLIDKEYLKDYDWDMLAGLDNVKFEIIKEVLLPLKYKDFYSSFEIYPSKGILLYGPPGNGKTTLAKIIANKIDASFFYISPKNIESRFVGESEKNIGLLFDTIRQISSNKHSIVFIDEIESWFPKENYIDNHTKKELGQFRQEWDGLYDLNNVTFIATTTSPEIVDTELMRPGRFSKHIYIPNPNLNARIKIFELYLRSYNTDNIDFEFLAKQTDGFSGADIKQVCSDGKHEQTLETIINDELFNFNNMTYDQILDYLASNKGDELKSKINKDYAEYIKKNIKLDTSFFIDAINRRKKQKNKQRISSPFVIE